MNDLPFQSNYPLNKSNPVDKFGQKVLVIAEAIFRCQIYITSVLEINVLLIIHRLQRRALISIFLRKLQMGYSYASLYGVLSEEQLPYTSGK